MSLPAGTRLASYEITGLLGAGGMGEVYRARDTRLGRDVALKILPSAVASDPDRLARFRREAQILASLNHPNIAQVYDTGTQATQPGSPPMLFIAMELVPGRTLADLIATEGALAPPAAVAIAIQISEALEAAHEQGIVHRDLKPANVKQRDDGVVKVLDFGLARPQGDSSDTASATSPTTLSPAMTEAGMILGTAAYMSPEQAKGRPADKRADIWAFGVVLYEMLTGRRPFHGDTVPEMMAAVIKDAPSLDALPATTTPALRKLIARCLERDPRERLRDIGEARIALRTALDPGDPLNRAAAAPVGPPPKRRTALTWALAGVGVVALAGLAAFAAWRTRSNGSVTPVRRFDLAGGIGGSTIALSPDGTRLAYIAGGHLTLHEFTTATDGDLGIPLLGAGTLFWSPDSQTIGFSVGNSLQTVRATGGQPFTVCVVPASGRVQAAAWRSDGTIFFAVFRDSLYQVPATGGTPSVRAAIKKDTEVDFHRVIVLPGDQLIVATHTQGSNGGDTRADLIDGNTRTALSDEPDIEPHAFEAPNQLLFVRQRENPGAWVAPFDGQKLDLARAVLIEPRALDVYASADGALVSIIPAKQMHELVWVSKTGDVTSATGPPFQSSRPRVALSADGRRALLDEQTPDGRDTFIVRDLTSGSDTRIPIPAGNAFSSSAAAWTPEGRLIYAAGGIETSKLYDWPVDGSSAGRELVSGISGVIAPGRTLLFLQDMRGHYRLLRAQVADDGSIGTAEPVFHGTDEPQVQSFDLSSDGHLLAVTVTDPVTSQRNIFVTTYPDVRERRQVTSSGGMSPRFSRDGRDLFFVGGTWVGGRIARGQLRVVSLSTSPITISAPRVLMTQGEGLAGGDRPISIADFDPATDGRLLMTRLVPAAPDQQARVVLLQNWQAAIRK